MHPALTLVKDRLPNIGERAELLFGQDDVFRELCEEYQVCSDTVGRMEGAAGASPALRNEYLALRLRLEGELLRYLADYPGS